MSLPPRSPACLLAPPHQQRHGHHPGDLQPPVCRLCVTAFVPVAAAHVGDEAVGEAGGDGGEVRAEGVDVLAQPARREAAAVELQQLLT